MKKLTTTICPHNCNSGNQYTRRISKNGIKRTFHYFEDFIEEFYERIEFIDQNVLSSNEFKSKIQNDIDSLRKFNSSTT